MAKKIKVIQLCEHLGTSKPEIDNPARIRCGKCRREWVWNPEEKAYVCVLDPARDPVLNTVGKLFK